MATPAPSPISWHGWWLTPIDMWTRGATRRLVVVLPAGPEWGSKSRWPALLEPGSDAAASSLVPHVGIGNGSRHRSGRAGLRGDSPSREQPGSRSRAGVKRLRVSVQGDAEGRRGDGGWRPGAPRETSTRVPHRRMLAVALAAPLSPAAPAHAQGLTGDWVGGSTRLPESVVAVRGDVTGFVQSQVAGTGDKAWETSSRYDAYVDLGFGKITTVSASAPSPSTSRTDCRTAAIRCSTSTTRKA